MYQATLKLSDAKSSTMGHPPTAFQFSSNHLQTALQVRLLPKIGATSSSRPLGTWLRGPLPNNLNFGEQDSNAGNEILTTFQGPKFKSDFI
jgi:hypothetical protein